MRREVVLAVALVAAMGQTRTPEAQLAEARRLYNEQRYADAIKLADDARQVPSIAAPASIVFARAHLEQYRAGSEVAGLEAARQALKTIDATKLAPRDQVEFAIALGQLLYSTSSSRSTTATARRRSSSKSRSAAPICSTPTAAIGSSTGGRFRWIGRRNSAPKRNGARRTSASSIAPSVSWRAT